MRFSRLIVTRATLVLTLAALGPAGAQVAGTETVGGFDGGAVVTITLTDVAGAVIARPAAGTPFRIQVALADPASDRPLTDEHLNGWIRPVEATNGQCRDAARANTLAGDNLARGTTDLGRSLYGVRHQDGTVSIVDWEHSLASANILAMVRTPDATGPITALSDDFAFALATGDGARLRIDAAAGTQPRPLTGFATQAPIISTPNGWMAQGTRLIAPDGQDITLPAPAQSMQPALFDADDSRYRGVVVLTHGGAAILAQAGHGALQTVQGPAHATAAAHVPDAEAMFFVDGSDRLTVIYGGRRQVTAPLPTQADRISVAPEGVFALAWSTRSGAVSILDVATAGLVQAVHLNRSPLDQPIREVAFAGQAAFLALQRLDVVVVLDLQQARRGEPAAARAVRIGPPVADLPADAGPFLLETARGHGSETVLALHPDLSTAFPVTRESGNATAPMNGFRIAGGRPVSMAELAGGLSEVRPGLYRAATVLAQGGPHQLIVSAGPGRFSTCLHLDVEGEVAADLTLRLLAQDRGRQGPLGRIIDLQLVDTSGVVQSWPARMPVILQSLETGWRQQVLALPQPAGGHRAVVAGPPKGLISVALDQRLPKGLSIDPTTIELRP